MYGSPAVPDPEVTPFADVKSSSPSMWIGSWGVRPPGDAEAGLADEIDSASATSKATSRTSGKTPLDVLALTQGSSPYSAWQNNIRVY